VRGLWLGFGSPFCALPVAVDLDDGSVDHRKLHVGIIRNGSENPFENIAVHPMAEPLEDRVPVPEILGQVAPRSAGARNPQHRLQKQPTVAAGPTGIGFLAEAMRLHLRPLRIRQDLLVIDCSLVLGA